MLFVPAWISTSNCDFHTMTVQPGQDATLMCSNFTSRPAHIRWFKLTSLNSSQISSMKSPDGNVSLFDGFQNGRFNMSSNTSTVFLKINQVNSSDSGLYFCGFNCETNAVIVSATHLMVQGKTVEKCQSVCPDKSWSFIQFSLLQKQSKATETWRLWVWALWLLSSL